jgi:molybdopterin biosynthesis enzyme MoaB
MTMRAAVLTVSDGVFWDEREDASGAVLADAAATRASRSPTAPWCPTSGRRSPSG